MELYPRTKIKPARAVFAAVFVFIRFVFLFVRNLDGKIRKILLSVRKCSKRVYTKTPQKKYFKTSPLQPKEQPKMEKEKPGQTPAAIPSRFVTPINPDFLEPKEYAAIVGVEVHSVYRWIRDGKLPAFRPSRRTHGRWAIPLSLLRADMVPDRLK